MSTALFPDLTPEFPLVWDSTRLSDAACPRKFFLRHVLGLLPQGESIHLHAGACLASALHVTRAAYYGLHETPEAAIIKGFRALLLAWGDADPEGNGTTKTLLNVCMVFEGYWERWPLESDALRPAILGGHPAIEYNFSVPLPLNHPTTGEPLLFTGRFDMVGEDRHGSLYGVDEKSTSQLGATWASQWDLRAQFTAYTWGAANFGHSLKGFFVRGLCMRKTGVEFAEALADRSEWMIADWLDMMIDRISRCMSYFQSNHYPKDLGELCNSYGGCSFKRLCTIPEPSPFVGPYFQVKRWSPLENGMILPSPSIP